MQNPETAEEVEVMYIFHISLLTFLAATFGTTTGFGTSTLMVPVLVMYFPPIEALFLSAIIHWFVNLWKIIFFYRGLDFRFLGLFGGVGFVASYLGASMVVGLDEKYFLFPLGFFLVSYSTFLILRGNFKIPTTRFLAMLGGALSGFSAGALGVGGPIRSMFLTAFNLPKETYIATVGAVGVLVDSARITAYFISGAQLPKGLANGLFVFIFASLLGAIVAKRIASMIPQQKFRQFVALFLFAIGLNIAFCHRAALEFFSFFS